MLFNKFLKYILTILNIACLFLTTGCDNNISVTGCIYPNSCNYNPEATEDDGSCIMPEGCAACTNPNACNYNPIAIEDDGSCEYPENLNENSWELAWYDCDGNLLDHRNQYIGQWEFHVERTYLAGNGSSFDPINGANNESTSYEFFVDSIKFGPQFNQILIPYTENAVPYVYNTTNWLCTVNEFGQLNNFSSEDESWWIEGTASGIWGDFPFGYFSYYSIENPYFNLFSDIDISNYYTAPQISGEKLLYIQLKRTFSTEIPLQNNDWNAVHFYIYNIYGRKLN